MWLSDFIRPAVYFGYRAANTICVVSRIIILSALAGAGFGAGLALTSVLARL